MDTKLIFQETELIHNRIQEAQTVIDEQRGKQLEIRELCSHEIIFSFSTKNFSVYIFICVIEL